MASWNKHFMKHLANIMKSRWLLTTSKILAHAESCLLAKLFAIIVFSYWITCQQDRYERNDLNLNYSRYAIWHLLELFISLKQYQHHMEFSSALKLKTKIRARPDTSIPPTHNEFIAERVVYTPTIKTSFKINKTPIVFNWKEMKLYQTMAKPSETKIWKILHIEIKKK